MTYQSGAGWLTADPASATNNATLFVTVHPDKIGPGTYQATIMVDAGPLAGSRVLPVTFNVTSGSGAGAPVVIGAVVNAASFQPVPLVAGSLATIIGTSLGGMSVSVTFDAVPAKLLYTGASQINLRVPAELALRTTAQMIVIVDGQSAAQTVALALVSPETTTRGAGAADGYSQPGQQREQRVAPGGFGERDPDFRHRPPFARKRTHHSAHCRPRHPHTELCWPSARDSRIAASQFGPSCGSPGGAHPVASMCRGRRSEPAPLQPAGDGGFKIAWLDTALCTKLALCS